ncbi:FAR-17a/AIG1-like protein [Hasllibacter halocynthiae]|uniref:FAR-17a/AIG1-like protein n=1 Tax=Hasllibacter halocynthiae TaxID=595589 RepID=A0A2T0X364_9RHOB|nr:hypothetical protein [Hasllibacter halocynthiae]PRY93378.1 FAR-17a/AIG1-like protein [Hasllibacter halocynthiae]
MDRIGGALGLWRLGVFLLAAGFWLYQFATQEMADFGWQFRFLTVWALTLSMLSGWFVLRVSLGWSDSPHRTLMAATAVINAMVVLLYWRLYLENPEQVNGTTALPPVQEWYLHALGPALQWVEALVLTRAFTRLPSSALAVLGVVAAYVLWIELAVQPLNEVPGGAVTTGLPYPFLNDMEVQARLAFYGMQLGMSLLALGAFWGLQRAWPFSSASRAASPSR